MVVILLSGCSRSGKNTANNSKTISTAADTYNEKNRNADKQNANR